MISLLVIFENSGSLLKPSPGGRVTKPLLPSQFIFTHSCCPISMAFLTEDPFLEAAPVHLKYTNQIRSTPVSDT